MNFAYFPIVNAKKAVFFSTAILSNAGYTLMSNTICDFKYFYDHFILYIFVL